MMYLAATVFPAPLSPLRPRKDPKRYSNYSDTNRVHRTGEQRGCSPDDDALVLRVDHHVPVHGVRQGVDVGGILVLGLNKDKRKINIFFDCLLFDTGQST